MNQCAGISATRTARNWSTEDIAKIVETFNKFEETGHSKIFPNEAFGYWKVTVDRPLRIVGIDPSRPYKASEIREMKATGTRNETGAPVIRRIHRRGCEPDPLRGLFAAMVGSREVVVEYEPDNELRDTEQIPLNEDGGIEGFLRREVLPYAEDAWYVTGSVKVGYEISFNRYFYRPVAMRQLEELQTEILALEDEPTNC